MKINESYMPLLKNWLYGIAFYVIPFIIGYLAFRFILSDNVLHTDVDSARYMLSALVQGEAAIVALVVTLSLVAVQLAAQSYSARVIEVFRRTPDLWILMGIYGVAMFFGLGVLKLIERANPQLCAKEYICLSNLEGHISGAYYLGVFAFVALVPYIWNTLEMLKPSTVIKMLAERITVQNILSSIKEDEKAIKGEQKTDEIDPILPVIDIVRGALMKYDYETVREGLKAISDRTISILKNRTLKGIEEEQITRHTFSHITRVGRMAASKKDDESTRVIITNLYDIGRATIEPESVVQAATSLEVVGTVAVEYKLEEAAMWAAFYTKEIGKLGIEQKLDSVAIFAINSLEKLGKAAAKQEIENFTEMIVRFIEEVGKAATEKNFEDVACQSAISLAGVGIAAAEQKLENATKQATFCLGRLGTTIIESESPLKRAAKQVAESLDMVGEKAAENKLEEATKWAAADIERVGVAAAKQKFEETTWWTVVYLRNIGREAADRKMMEALKQVIESLEEILKISREQGLAKASQQAKEAVHQRKKDLNKLEIK